MRSCSNGMETEMWIELNLKMLILTMVLFEAGASLSAVDNEVIKSSVKLIQSNIKLFK